MQAKIMIAIDMYRVLPMAASHLLFQLWEAGAQCTGFRRLLKLRVTSALGMAILINALYVSIAVIFVR